MEKMRAVLISMVLAAAQVAPVPVSADDIIRTVETYRNQGTNRCMDDFRVWSPHLGLPRRQH